ncbi:MAG: Crp/Fnr family transcriptional regulator [Actinomycetota bacterium]
MATHVAWVARSVTRPDLAPLTPDELASLARVAGSASVQEDAVIARAGDETDTAYIVLNGEVELHVAEQGRHGVVGIVRDGGSFGEIPMLCEMILPFSAVATQPTQLIQIERARLADVMREAPEVAARWMTNTVRRLEYANRRIAALTVGDLRNRLLSVLAEEAESGNAVSLTQTELAALLGATRQSVNRVIGKLAREGVVRQRYGVVEIIDHAALLRSIADVGATPVDEER